MPNGIFNQQIQAQPASQQVVAPVTANPTATAISAATPFIDTAVQVGIGFQQQGQLTEEFDAISSELSGLDQQFSGYAQAIQSGQNKGALQMRARAALKSAVASSPVLRGHAESLYSKYFGGAGTGGGGTSGAFSMTPEEEQAKKIQSEIADYTLLGYSDEQATQIAQNKRAATAAKSQAEKLASQAEVKLYEVAPLVEADLSDQATQFNVALQTELQAGGGTINPETKLTMSRQIDSNLIQAKRRYQQAVTDPSTGRLTVSPAAFKEMMTRYETQSASFKELLNDNGQQKYLQDKASTLQANSQVIAYQALPTISVLRAAGGDAFATQALTLAGNGNKLGLEWLKQTNPQYAQFLEGDFKAGGDILVEGTGKLFQQDEQAPVLLTETEGVLVGDSMGSNAQYAMTILEKAGAGTLQHVTKHYPQAIGTTFTPQTQSVRTTKAAAFKQNIQDLQNGVVTRFSSQFRDSFGRFPGGVELVVEQPDPATLRSTSQPYVNFANIKPRISVNLASGEQMSQEMVNMVADLYRSVEANPEAVPDALKGKGLRTEEIVSLWVNSGLSTEQLKFYAPMTDIVSASRSAPFQYGTQRPEVAASEGTSSITDEAERRGGGKPQTEGQDAPQEEKPLTQGELPPDKVVQEVKRLKSEGYSLDFLLASFDQYNLRGDRSIVRQQIETAYDLPVAGFDN